jgi:hypothetical protein
MRDNTTPRPWSTSREDMDSFTVNQDDTTGETEHVVYIYRGDQPRIGVFAGKLDNARADANLIVEAVNSYSARVARAMESIATPEPAADPRVAEAPLRAVPQPDGSRVVVMHPDLEAAARKANSKPSEADSGSSDPRVAEAVADVLDSTAQRLDGEGPTFDAAATLRSAARRLRRSAQPVEALLDDIVRQVAELPDRSSPEDWPEAMLVTSDELRSILTAILTAQAGDEGTGGR